MSNDIKNRIEIVGTKAQVSEVVKRFSTRISTETHFIDPSDIVQMEKYTTFPDFEKIIPMPESLHIEDIGRGDLAYAIINENNENLFMSMSAVLSTFYALSFKERIETLQLGIKYAKNVVEHGYKTYYDWSIKHWGTKWNCYECKGVSESVFEFETAGHGVPNLIKIMSEKFPDVKFIYEWSSNHIGRNCGYVTYLNGNGDINTLENHSREAYELAFKLHPDRKEHYKLVGDTYEFA